MERYLSWRMGRTITEQEFLQTIAYFKDVAQFIYENRKGSPFIRENASLEVEIEEECYEVWVNFDSFVEDGQHRMLVDFDYSYDLFV